MKSLLFGVLLIFIGNPAIGQTYIGEKAEIKQILENGKNFSKYVNTSDYKMIGESYTKDAKIFPNNLKIIEGTEDILGYWRLPKGITIINHKIDPIEIKIIGNEAYDYGTYQGTTKKADGEEITWKGKYVIVWKKVGSDWKMYLDIWNSIK
ncbi:hypothetical protein ATO12_02840 [Aquimarina atlantica]|uniref:DUF4440 domain-containing protein n=1 Tax=Aquimarina atlantica TaxID=1317122 RepID=A0A023C1C7_9FLAO|nr:nuclear transport factor 2 family protein [Aquimarina atlantica]EZH75743.1 hypothetical protein ATO12_02840 [Aquimarina atlantica]